MKTITVDELRMACIEQANTNLTVVFKCPMCGCLQMGQDFIDAGAATSSDQAMDYAGFSCLGRFTKAGEPRKNPDGKRCNWTLGGLFQFHKLEVVTPDGQSHLHFELATKADADVYRATQAAKQGPTHDPTV